MEASTWGAILSCGDVTTLSFDGGSKGWGLGAALQGLWHALQRTSVASVRSTARHVEMEHRLERLVFEQLSALGENQEECRQMKDW